MTTSTAQFSERVYFTAWGGACIMVLPEYAMNKEFDQWNEKKKEIEHTERRPFFKEGDVWWVHLGLNVGCEIDGIGARYERPVIVLKRYNMYSFLAVPLSTAKKSNEYEIPVGSIKGKENVAIISQLRNIDSKRLIDKAAEIEKEVLAGLKEKASRMNFG